MYNYLEALVDDIKVAFKEHNWESDLSDRNALEAEMNDVLFIDDSVTGNASGSYTCNSNVAKEYVIDNLDTLRDTCNEFGIEAETIGTYFLDDDWEYFDVTIRCYLLGQAISKYLDDYYSDNVDK